MNEAEWEEKLRIQTSGVDSKSEDVHHCRYEPTPYAVLLRLADSGYLSQENILVDYGCGKGRVGFFLNHVLGCRTIGVEHDRSVYEQALVNCRTYGTEKPCRFFWGKAEQFAVGTADRFYFFNPFSLEILKTVYGRILESYYESPRRLLLFFYYPTDEYRSWLMTEPTLSCLSQIDCGDLFCTKNPQECILIFEISI